MNKKYKFFCIIEEDTVRAFFEIALKSAGHQVYSLSDLEDASFRIQEFAPEVLILDTSLVAPQREIVASWETINTKVLGLGFVAEKELWGNEIDAFLEKPLSPGTLVEKILELV